MQWASNDKFAFSFSRQVALMRRSRRCRAGGPHGSRFTGGRRKGPNLRRGSKSPSKPFAPSQTVPKGKRRKPGQVEFLAITQAAARRARQGFVAVAESRKQSLRSSQTNRAARHSSRGDLLAPRKRRARLFRGSNIRTTRHKPQRFRRLPEFFGASHACFPRSLHLRRGIRSASRSVSTAKPRRKH